MKPFIGRDFLLNTDTAKRLYEEHADMKRIPILDYHCHINPQEIYEDRQFENIAQVWLADARQWCGGTIYHRGCAGSGKISEVG